MTVADACLITVAQYTGRFIFGAHFPTACTCRAVFPLYRPVKVAPHALRTYSKGGEVYLTHGVSAKGGDFVARAFQAVADFDEFTEGNDPYGEHDFGAVTVDGERVFFKVDTYDRNKEYGSEDAADPTVTARVLTILLAEEY